MGKNYTIYVNNQNDEDFGSLPKGEKGSLINSLLAEHYSKVQSKMEDFATAGIRSASSTSLDGNTMRTTVTPHKGDVRKFKARMGVALPTSCPNGHLLNNGLCMAKGCKYGKRKQDRSNHS